MELYCEKFGAVVTNDLVKLTLGKEIGYGAYRTVYECAFDDDLVLKVRNPDAYDNFANAYEWEVWENVQWTPFAKWFAPCVKISPDGTVLVQKKTAPLTDKELKRRLPKVPAFFTDIKGFNWGLYEGRVVCHDYATHLLHSKGLSCRMKKATW